MNWWAARALFGEELAKKIFPYDKYTAAVGRAEKDWTVEQITEHEIREADYMRKGMSYLEAHSQVLLDMKDYNTRAEAEKDAEDDPYSGRMAEKRD